MAHTFTSMIEKASRQNNSRLVLALDIKNDKLVEKAKRLLDEVSSYICCVKLNKHLLLPLSLNEVLEIVDEAHEACLPVIADCKMCDIGLTNEVEASMYFNANFDAITVMPLPGWTDGLEGVFKLASERGKGVLVVTHMSHRGAIEFFDLIVYDQSVGVFDALHRVFTRRARMWGADGLIIGATRPEVIAYTREVIGDKPIFAPGAITQGGNPIEALRAGASYIIIGRAICESHDPARRAKEINDMIMQCV